jgi:hypothetical protein
VTLRAAVRADDARRRVDDQRARVAGDAVDGREQRAAGGGGEGQRPVRSSFASWKRGWLGLPAK